MSRKKKFSNWKELIGLVIVVAAIFILWHIANKPAEEQESVVEPTAVPVSAVNPNCTVTETTKAENLNRDISVNSLYKDSTMVTSSGVAVPDIMSENIMTLNFRKCTLETEKSTQVIHMSGPNICINGHMLPSEGFYASYDYNRNRVEYYICASCFREAGFLANSSGIVTCYDYAVRQTGHDIWIPADELEMHTTWVLEKYDSDTQTYYFNVEQDGPFSGKSDVFSVYIDGERCNTMPQTDSIAGTQTVEYSQFNDYWSTLEMSRNALRTRVNKKYHSEYSQLSYDGDTMLQQFSD